jgi:phage FluMu protein Com
MKVKCSYCQKIISIPDEYAGKDFKCPHCHQVSVASPVVGTSDHQESSRNLWIFWIVVAAGLAVVIGFVGGVLLTKPNRDKTNATIAAIEAKAGESQKKTQEEIRAAKNEIARLQREPRSVTQKLKQTEGDLKPIPQKPVTPKTSERISEVMTPIFGIRLGELLRSLKGRLTVTASTYSFEDKDHPGEIWNINPPNPSVKRLMVYTFNERIYSINILFADGSKTNYETIREQLRKKYQSEDKGGFTGAMFGEAEFTTTLDGVQIGIKLNHDIGFMEDDKLDLNYIHIALQQKVLEEVQKRKAKKVITDL